MGVIPTQCPLSIWMEFGLSKKKKNKENKSFCFSNVYALYGLQPDFINSLNDQNLGLAH